LISVSSGQRRRKGFCSKLISFNTMQVYDGLLLDGKLADYEAAFNAVDVSGNGTLGG